MENKGSFQKHDASVGAAAVGEKARLTFLNSAKIKPIALVIIKSVDRLVG